HAYAAATTNDQPGQQSSAATNGPLRLTVGTVFCKSSNVCLVLIPRDVSRVSVTEQDLPLVRWKSTRAIASRFTARLIAATIDIRSCVHWMNEHVPERCRTGPTPLQATFVRAAVNSPRHPDVAFDHPTQEAGRRAEPLELLEDQQD